MNAPRSSRILTCITLIGYILFLFSSFLFFITPSEHKQFLGYQYYLLMEDFSDANIESGDIIVAHRIPFVAYKKGDWIVYLNQDDVPVYTLQRIVDIDLANYSVQVGQSDVVFQLSKEQVLGIVDSVFIPNGTISFVLWTDVLVIVVFVLSVLVCYQLIHDRLETSKDNQFSIN